MGADSLIQSLAQSNCSREKILRLITISGVVFNTALPSQTELPLNGSDEQPLLSVETTWKL